MVDVETARFTVGVFQDVAWAQKGIDALKNAGLPADALSVMAKESPEVGRLIEHSLGAAGERLETAATGALLVRGPLVAALQGATSDFSRLGIAGTMRRVGFLTVTGAIRKRGLEYYAANFFGVKH